MADRFHILIVEDDPLIVDVMVASLESDYRVSSVNTVGAALAFLRTSHVDVVLIDNVFRTAGALKLPVSPATLAQQ